MPKDSTSKPNPMIFESIAQVDLPHGRNGKHKVIVEQLLSDLQQLAAGQALKVQISQLPDSKENIRSALNRATRQRGMNVATATDANYLYVWKPDEASAEK
jgi:hypothetical protein